MRPISFRPWMVPLALLGLAGLGFGIFIPWYGLYGDDWIYLWAYHLMGAGFYSKFVAMDRPFSAWIYTLITPLLSESVWAYHLLLTLLCFLDAVLVWWLLRLIWPKNGNQAVWVAVLFLLYPGFNQQPLPLEFVLHFSVLALLLLSLVMMVKSILMPGRFWLFTGISLISAMGVFSLEYFAGLELLRPILLWMVLAKVEPLSRKLKLLTVRWLPYLAVLAGFLIWRVFVFKFQFYQPNLVIGMTRDPATALPQLALRILGDLKTVTLDAWRQTLSLPAKIDWLYGIILLVGLLATMAFLYWLPQNEENYSGAARKVRQEWPFSACILGIFSLLIAGGPFWLTNVPVELSFPWDRSTLAFMFGASLLVAGLVGLIIQPRFQAAAIAGLVMLGLGLRYQNATYYAGEWQRTRQMFWQLVWRAPALAPGTILVSDQIPLFRSSDNDMKAILNWMYAPDLSTRQVPYMFFDLSVRKWGKDGFPKLAEGQDVSHNYRAINFDGNSSNMMTVFFNPPECLRVLSKGDALPAGLPESLSAMLGLSKISQIVNNEGASTARPDKILGPEPAHDWCYLFEKADLARQAGDWQQITALADQASSQGLKPAEQSEYIPFIEAYARTGKWDKARQLSQVVMTKPQLNSTLCSTWLRINRIKNMPTADQQTINAIRQEIGCLN
jgi:hypothetical protein